MQTTTRNGLKKSESTDTYLATRSGNNDNFDVIDAAIAKCNWAGGALDPTADDDEADGYSAGSMWITDTAIWICIDASEGDAVWEQLWPAKAADLSGSLSANWDAGDYEVRAKTLQSDVATGTAPLTVASTTKVTNLHADILDGAELSTDVIADPGVDTKIPSEKAIRTTLTNLVATLGLDGWLSAGETWTYAGADSPSFTFTISGDKSTKYYPGMRIKLTQSSTVKYFIVTKVSYSSPNTTITIYGGTDYSLANEAISSPYYSMVKAPTGFPLDPAKWTVTATLSGSQSNPTQNTIYNLGGSNIVVPIGAWFLVVKANIQLALSSGAIHMLAGMSTTNNTFEISDFYQDIYNSASNNLVPLNFYYPLNISSKTTYYFVAKSVSADGTVLQINSEGGTCWAKAICAYL